MGIKLLKTLSKGYQLEGGDTCFSASNRTAPHRTAVGMCPLLGCPHTVIHKGAVMKPNKSCGIAGKEDRFFLAHEARLTLASGGTKAKTSLQSK